MNTHPTEDEPDSLLETAQNETEHPSRRTVALRTLTAIAISAAGGFTAQALQLPAGLLMGGALAVAIAALAGIKVVVPTWLRDIAFVFTGVSMGASVARDSLSLVTQWPISLIGLAVELVIIIASTGYMLRRLFALDNGTAYLSSFPGHLSFVMGIASSGVGDTRQITIIQVIRILMLTICVPIGAIFLPIDHFANAVALPPMSVQTLLLLVAGCGAVGFVATRFKVPAGFVLGAMAAATAAKLTGLFEGAMPPPVLTATYVLIGALIGSRFSGITWPEFRRAAIGGFIATLMTVAIVTFVAYVVSLFVDMPFGQIWLGLSPGALEGMGALGVALGYDTAFIAAHHVSRLLMLTIAIPLVVYVVAPGRAKTEETVMVKTTLIVSIALAGLAMSASGAMAVPFCTPTASSLSYGIGNNGRVKRNYDDEISRYTSELNRRGYDTTLVETWNGCVRAWVRVNGKEQMMFFDPNNFREVN